MKTISESSQSSAAGQLPREDQDLHRFGRTCAFAWKRARFANQHLPWNHRMVDHGFVARVLASWYVEHVAADYRDCLLGMQTWRRIHAVPLTDAQLERAVSDALFIHEHREVVDAMRERDAAIAMLTFEALQRPM